MLVEGLPRATWGSVSAATWAFAIDGEQDRLEKWFLPVLQIVSGLGHPRRVSWASPSAGGEDAVVLNFDGDDDANAVFERALAERPKDTDLVDVEFDLEVTGLEGDRVRVPRGLRLRLEPWGDGDTPDRLEGVLFFHVDVLAPSAGSWENSELAALNSVRLGNTLGALAALADSWVGGEVMAENGYPPENFSSKKTELLAEWRGSVDSQTPVFHLSKLLQLLLTDAEIDEVFSRFVAGEHLEERYRRYVGAATGSFRAGSDDDLLREASFLQVGLRSLGEKLTIPKWTEIQDSLPQIVDGSTHLVAAGDVIMPGMTDLLSLVRAKPVDPATASYVRDAPYLCAGLPISSRPLLEGYLLGPLVGVGDELNPLLTLWQAGASFFVDHSGQSRLIRNWR